MKRPIFLLFCLICLIIFLFNPAAYRPDPVFPLGEDYDVEVSGCVAARSSQDNRLSMILEDCLIFHAGRAYRCSRLTLTVFADNGRDLPQVRAGNLVQAEASLSLAEPARNPGNFDWYAYNQSRHIRYQATADSLTITDNTVNCFREGLMQLQSFLGEQLTLLCGDDSASASVLRALLLGDRSALDERTEALYEEGGILHILSVSGFHVSLLGSICLALSRRFFLPPKLQRLLAALLALLYWQLCGQSVSAGRAAVMFVCLCLAFPAERTYDSLSALAAAGIFFLLDSPSLLLQAGFQLSYCAVLAIRLVCPVFAGLAAAADKHLTPFFKSLEKELPRRIPSSLRRLPARLVRSLLHALLFGLGLQLTLLPVTLYHFFRYPVYGLLLNLIVLPLSSPLFICAAAGLLFSFCHPLAGRLLLIPSRIILRFFEELCSLASSLPFSSFLGGRPSPWRIIVYYLLLTFLCLYLQGKIPRKPSSSLRAKFRPLFLCALALAVLILPAPSSGLRVTFLDIGQGDCAFILSPDGTSILIDGGSSDISSAAEQRLIPFLEAQRIDKLDYVFISHTDADHTNAVIGFLEAGYEVGALILPDLPAHLAGEESFLQLFSLAHRYKIPLYLTCAGDSFTLDELSFLCLAPVPPENPEAAEYTSLNNASQVLLLEYQGVRILFTGDCGEEGEELLTAQLAMRGISSCHVLKAGHHGSSTSSSEELLEQLRPMAAVISCGAGNRYGHPHPETLDRFYARDIPVFATASCGAVTLHIRGGHLFLSAMLAETDRLFSA